MKRLFANHSIQARLTLASTALLPMICILLAWSLTRAFSASVYDNLERQMTLQAYALMASAELHGETLSLPQLMSDDQLNQISSDSFAAVSANNNDIIWRSLSALDRPLSAQRPLAKLDTGQRHFSTNIIDDDASFVFQYAVEWESENRISLPLQFIVYEKQAPHLAQISSYQHTLWLWLGGTMLTLICLQLIILRWGLKPLARLIQDIEHVKQGVNARLGNAYPKELTTVTSSINQLIAHEEQQRERYRNTLADLAHSIKNPVAIIASELENTSANAPLPEETLTELQQQNMRIDQIVSYQLNRAVDSAASPFHKALPVKPVCDQVLSALQKVYSDKHLSVELKVSQTAIFKGDEGDLMELLGNLLDNAFKYGAKRIQLEATGDENGLRLSIDDGGPGLDSTQRQHLVHRGARADTKLPGQGIGLAIVNDIVKSYRGELLLARSALGGLRVTLVFSWQ